jgi:hypothetical protein
MAYMVCSICPTKTLLYLHRMQYMPGTFHPRSSIFLLQIAGCTVSQWLECCDLTMGGGGSISVAASGTVGHKMNFTEILLDKPSVR